MAFNAGSIEASLTLDRTAFTAGLRAAKAEAEKFAKQKFNVTITPKLDRTALQRIKADIERVTGNIKVKVSLDNASLQAVKQRIDRTVGNIKAKVDVDLTAAKAKLNSLRVTVNVNLNVTAAEKARIKAEIERISPTIVIRLRYDRDSLDELIRRLREARSEADRFGDSSDRAFGSGGTSRIAKFGAAIVALAPLIASAATAAAGTLGGLLSIVGTLAGGFGALAIVAIPLFKDIQDGATKSWKEIAKMPPGLREASTALKVLLDDVDKLKTATTPEVGRMFAAGFDAAKAAIGPLVPLIKQTALGATDVANKFKDFFNSSQYQGFVDFLAVNIRPMLDKIGTILVNTVKGVIGLVEAFKPLADWILDKINAGMKAFADWAGQLGSDKAFQQWLLDAQHSMEIWWNLIKQILIFLGHLIEGLRPLGDVVATVIGNLFEMLNKIPPEFLGPIALGIAAIFAAIAVGAGGPVALGIGAVAALSVALATLYQKNEAVHKSLDDFVSWLKQTWQPIWDAIQKNFDEKIVPAWDRLTKTVKEDLWPALQSFGKVLGDEVIPKLVPLANTIFGQVIPAFIDFLSAVTKVVAFFIEHWGPDIAKTLGDMVTIFDGTLKMVAGILETAAGLLTGDWQKFGDGLKTITEGFWTIIAGIFGTNLDGLKAKFAQWDTDINAAYQTFWDGFKSKTDGGSTATQNAWTVMLDGIKSYLGTKSTEINTAWNDFWGIFTGRSTQGQGDNRSVVQIMIDGIQSYLGTKSNEISTAWDQFWGIFTQRTNTGGTDNRSSIQIAMDAISALINTTTTNITTAWNNFWTGVSNLTNSFCNTIQQRIAEFGPWITQRVQEAATAIGTAWRAVANFFKDPINWVINVVLNNGILNAWNTVMGWIGQPALKAAPIPQIPGYAEGGQVRGPGTGVSDSIPALLSAGEFVVSSKYARQHAHFLAALNSGQAEAVQAAGGGNNPNRYPRYQAGGPVDAGLNFARAQTGKPYVWGGVGPGGYDCSGFMSAIANVLLGRNPYSRIGTTASAPWPGWNPNLTSQFGVGFFRPTGSGAGQEGHMAGTLGGTNVESGSGHGPMTGGLALGAMSRQFGGHMSLPQAGGSFIGGPTGAAIVQQVVSWWSQVGDKATALFNGLMNYGGMPGLGSPIGNAITGLPTALVKKSLAALQTKLEHLFTTITVAGTPSAAGGAAGGDVTAQVKAVADRYGWGTGPEWNALSMLIQKESGWSTTAANPTSSARGLFQKMTSIHGPVEPTATGQAEWGLNYIKGKYGDPINAWAFHQAHNWYDRGGMLPHGISPINTGAHAERILSPQQTDDFHRLVSMLQDLVSPGVLSRGDTYHVMLPAGASVRELANEIDFRKRVSDKGRYRPR